jgi:proline iminopeptidase
VYPPAHPTDRGQLEVGDGNRVYWEECGNPDGRPAVVLHGGPGSGCTSGMRRFFDPDAYRIVLFDQRGCGRSTPNASEPGTDLSVNTTRHLLDDIDRLRTHLRIDRWLVLGLSWGTTLGLAYALRRPDRVAAMVLAGVTLGSRSEVDWLYRGVAPHLPGAWARFRDGVPDQDRDGDLVEAYHRLLHDPDPAVRAEAARRWTDWDWATSSVDPSAARPARWDDPTFQLARARICTHYFRHDLFLEDGLLLRAAPALAGIPGVLVNGHHDLQCPLPTAQALADAWPGSELVVVDGAGHSTADPGMEGAIVAATDHFAR